jgi:MiaB/RimO family radical SAM methylthiotransferase
VNDLRQAEVIIFWACGLTKSREIESLAVIDTVQKTMTPGTRLVVWGCLPKINRSAMAKIYDTPLAASTDIGLFENILKKSLPNFDILDASGPENLLVSNQNYSLQRINQVSPASVLLFFEQACNGLYNRAKKNTKFWIRIASGCTGHCTYCSERCVFGRIRSRPMDRIISDMEVGLKHGFKLFSLIATDVGAYGRDAGYTLADLLERMVSMESKTPFKIILNQVNPFYLKEMFPRLERIFSSGKIAALNCPVQSGSDRILKLMGRIYSANEWRDYMLRINRKFPEIRLSTHFMIGFPTETDQDFDATMRLLDYPLLLDKITIFKFSGRPSVYASHFSGQVSEKTKESRSRKLSKKYTYMYLLNSSIRWSRSIFGSIR